MLCILYGDVAEYGIRDVEDVVVVRHLVVGEEAAEAGLQTVLDLHRVLFGIQYPYLSYQY